MYFGIFEFFFLHLARQQGEKNALSNSSLHLFLLLLLRRCRLRLCFRGLGPEPNLPVGPGGRSQPPDAARGGAPAGASPGGSRRGGERPSDSGDGGTAAALARVRRPGRVAGPAAVEGREEGVDPGVLTRAEDFERFLGLVGEGDRGRDEVGQGREGGCPGGRGRGSAAAAAAALARHDLSLPMMPRPRQKKTVSLSLGSGF